MKVGYPELKWPSRVVRRSAVRIFCSTVTLPSWKVKTNGSNPPRCLVLHDFARRCGLRPAKCARPRTEQPASHIFERRRANSAEALPDMSSVGRGFPFRIPSYAADRAQVTPPGQRKVMEHLKCAAALG